MNLEFQDVDDLRRELFRELVLDQRNVDVIAGEHDMLDFLLAHDAFEHVNQFSRVIGLKLLDMTLVALLRPSSTSRAVDLVAFDRFGSDRSAATKDEHARSMAISQNHRVDRVLIEH